jgi:hypothetical protein
MSDTLEDCWPVIDTAAAVLRKVATIHQIGGGAAKPVIAAVCIGTAEALECLRPGGPGLLAATRKLLEAAELAERIKAEQGGTP